VLLVAELVPPPAGPPPGTDRTGLRARAEIHTVRANGGVAKGRRLMSGAGCRRDLRGIGLAMVLWETMGIL
jgi:hypothetical protein